MIVKILASAITGIGGHYLNRRWDKAVLFCCLFILYCVAVYLFCWHLLDTLSFDNANFAHQLASYGQLLKRIITAGIFSIWLLSLVITFLDHRRQTAPNLIRWTPSAVVGAVVSSGITMLILFFGVSTAFTSTFIRTGSTETRSYESGTLAGPPRHNFYASLYFGGEPRDSEKLPAPPHGDGLLRGQITYHGKPAQGIMLHVVLNGKYKSADLVTDSDGIFTVSLEPGHWRINSIQTMSWENRPDNGNFTMYHGEEAKLRGGKYDRYMNWMQDGYEVEVGNDPEAFHLKASISDDIRLVWPGSKSKADDATIEDSITWESYPGAAKYYVELSRVTKEGNSTIYSPITGKVVTGGITSLSLSSLKHRTVSNAEKRIYSVDVFAFASDNALIGEYSNKLEGGSFTLTEGVVFIEDEKDKFFGLSDIESQDAFEKTIAEISANERKGNAVAVLLEEGMLEEAKKLIDMMDSKFSKGRKEVMAGYLLAIGGDCVKASEMFGRAALINPDVCIADRYWAACEH